MSRRRNVTQQNRLTRGISDYDEDIDQTDGFHPLNPEDGFIDSQFYHMHPPFPFKTAFCVMTFLIIGTTCLICSLIITLSTIEHYKDRAGVLFICGLLLFTPGAYFTSIMLRTYFSNNGQPMAEVLPQF